MREKEQKFIEFLESLQYSVNKFQVWQAENDATLMECVKHFKIPKDKMRKLLGWENIPYEELED